MHIIVQCTLYFFSLRKNHILCFSFFFLLFFSKSKQIKKNKWLVFEKQLLVFFKQIVLHTICFLILFLEKKNIVCILFFLEKKNIVCLCFPLKQIKTMNQSLFKNKKKSVKPWQYTYTLLPFAHIFLNVIFLFFNKKNDVIFLFFNKKNDVIFLFFNKKNDVIFFFYKKTKNVIVLAFFNNKVNIILSSACALMLAHSFLSPFFLFILFNIYSLSIVWLGKVL